jgi:hypothetical protein
MNTASESFIPTAETIENMRDALLRAHPFNIPAVNFLCNSALLNLIVPKCGVDLIAAERRRQITQEGWTPGHDDEHDAGELASAGASYALNAACVLYPLNGTPLEEPPICWMWDRKWWKPKGPLSDLVRAGALIAAEIDKLQRVTEQQKAVRNPAAPWPFPDWKP